MLKIIKHPNKILRKKSKNIEIETLKDPEFKKLLIEMEETMFKKDGVGLAAPQIGKNIRLIVINKSGKALKMINPEITKKSWSKKTEEEACLSVENEKGEMYFEPVSRHRKINCQYLDSKGKRKKIKAKDLLARIIQHETDHLDGILFIDISEK